MPLPGRNLDARLLHELYRAGEDGISIERLSALLAADADAVSGTMAELHKLGYEIQNDARACRLIASPDLLHADDLFARLGAVKIIGREIYVFAQTTSTNDVAEKLASDGVDEGVVVFAENQTKGRGRLGRHWSSASGAGLWLSTLLRPRIPPQAATRLTIAAANSVARAIHQELQISPEIKWPNDLLLRGRKVAGILTEMRAELDSVGHVILGIGINVNQPEFPPEIKELAISLRQALGTQVDRPALAAAVLRELDRDYTRVLAGEFGAVAEEWESRCGTLGRCVSIRCGDRVIAGQCESLDGDGALLVRTEHGMLERVTGGDVTVLKD